VNAFSAGPASCRSSRENDSLMASRRELEQPGMKGLNADPTLKAPTTGGAEQCSLEVEGIVRACRVADQLIRHVLFQ